MSDVSQEGVELVGALEEWIARVATPGSGIVEAAVEEEGTPLVEFLAKAGVDHAKATGAGLSFIDENGRILGPDTLVLPSAIITTATNRDNGQ